MKKRGDLNIVYVNHGLGNRYTDGTIELNKHLVKYPRLHKAIVKHELRHTDDSNMTRHDLLHDLTIPDQIRQLDVLKFCLRHPSSLSQLLPVIYHKKRGIVIDKNLILIYCVLLFLILMAWVIT